MPDRWRLGTHNPFTVYRVADGAHDVDHAREHFVTSFRREEDARQAVDAVNAQAARAAVFDSRCGEVHDDPEGDPIGTIRWGLDHSCVAIKVSVSAADPWHWWLSSEDDRVTDEAVRAMAREWHPDVQTYLHRTGLSPAQSTTPPSCDCPDTDGAEPAGSAVGQRGAPTREVEAVIEAFARHRHEATGRDIHNGENVRPDGDARGASPIGLCTWAEAPEDWREGYRELCRREADVALAALRDGGADIPGAEDESLRPGDEVIVWGAERNRGYAVGTVESGGTFPRGIAKPVVHLRHTNFEQRDEPDEDVEPRCGALHPEYGFTCPYLPNGHGRWHWDPAGGYWDAAGQYIDGAEDVAEQPDDGADTDGEDEDDEVRMPPPERETIYATSADPHGSVDLNRSTGVLVATCRCGESATMWGGGGADAQRWWDKHRLPESMTRPIDYEDHDAADEFAPPMPTMWWVPSRVGIRNSRTEGLVMQRYGHPGRLYGYDWSGGWQPLDGPLPDDAVLLVGHGDYAHPAAIPRLARALGVSLDPDDPDPVGTLEAAAGKAREDDLPIPDTALDRDGDTYWCAGRNDHVWRVASGDVKISALGNLLSDPERFARCILAAHAYRAPAPAPAALAVGEVVTGQRAVAAPVGTKLGAKNAAVAAVHTTNGWSVTGMNDEQDHEHAVRINEWVVLALGGRS